MCGALVPLALKAFVLQQLLRQLHKLCNTSVYKQEISPLL